jgi:RNA polymerase sigma-70 factor, ECF subfamily
MANPESTAVLLIQARQGSGAARDRLVERYLPLLRGWASGRVPAHARASLDTDDLVQVTLIKALERLETFEPQREGAFLAYLRSILLNALRDHLRRSAVRTSAGPPNESLVDPNPTVIEEVLGRETLSRYEASLMELTEEQREAVILRVEFGYSHQEIADAIGSPSANAARMLVSRGLLRLAELMNDARP